MVTKQIAKQKEFMQLTQEQVLTNFKNNYEECSLASCSFWVTSFWTKETIAELEVVGKVLWKLIKTFLLVALTLLTALFYYSTFGAIKMWNLLTQAANPIPTILNVLEVSSDEFAETKYIFDSKVVEEVATQQDLRETADKTTLPFFPPIVGAATSRIKSFLTTPISELRKTSIVESKNLTDTGETNV